MTIKPFYMTGSKSTSTNPGEDNSAEIMDAMPVNQVFVKNTLGKLVGIGIRQLADGTILAPDNFGVESGSINFGDLITVSEAAGYLGMYNHLDKKQYQFLDYYVPRDKASSKPFYFRLVEGEYKFDGMPDNSKTITENPLIFDYTTKLDARTNSIVLTADSVMKNVRMRISKGDVTLKYLPTKAAYLGQEMGYDFQVGENILDFGDSPVPLQAGTMLTYEIIADSIALRGSNDNIPKMSSYIQKGEYVGLLSSGDVSKVATSGDYNDLENKPTIPTVKYPVNSVNGKTGKVVLTAFDVGAAEEEHMHSISEVEDLEATLEEKMDKSGTISYSQITDAPVIPPAPVQPNWTQTDASSLDFIKNKPTLFNGDYNALSNKPTLFSGRYAELIGAPALSTVAETGSYVDLKDKPALFNGDYNSLTNKPTIPVVSYPVTSVNAKTGAVVLSATDVGAAETNHTHKISDVTGLTDALSSKWNKTDKIPYASLSDAPVIPSAPVNPDWNASSGLAQILNKPLIFSGNYNDLSNKPVLFSGNYADLTGKPNLFSGNYNDLTNKPTIPVTSVNAKTGAVTLTAADVGAAAVSHNHAISEITGLQTALDGKISTGANIPYSSITGKPTIPTNTSQITENTNLYYTDARVQAYLASSGFRRVETLQGTTNASGVYQVTFANTYAVAPHVNPFIVNGSPAQMITVSNITTTGCTVTVQQRNSVTLLGLEVLLAATVAVPNAVVGVLVVAKA